jgi:hypothetical protein
MLGKLRASSKSWVVTVDAPLPDYIFIEAARLQLSDDSASTAGSASNVLESFKVCGKSVA